MSTDDKYDRQLRLWGPHGQKRLQNARVLLIGCDPVGIETLKNLVLPGIGFIVIVDHKEVCKEDVDNNFFFPYFSIGQPRAKIALEYLLEMNSDVQGEWHQTKNYDLNNKHYDLIIANEAKNFETKFNLIELQTYGFIGRIRIYSPSCNIIESKPLGKKIDLRIFNPFEELKEYFDSIEIDGDLDYVSHIPYIAILYKALQVFKNRNGRYPTTFSEKHTEFKEIILELGKNLAFESQANFYEAIDNIDQAFYFQDWQTVLENFTTYQPLQKQMNEFWHLIQGLREFINIQSIPPLSNQLPDMKCFTQTYLHLKNNIYGHKVEKDFNLFKSLLKVNISDEKIRLFINNIPHLHVINYRTVQQELISPKEIEDFDTNCHIWYILLRAIDQFFLDYHRYPTQQVNDQAILKSLSVQIGKQLGFKDIEDKYILEACRYQGAKLQMIAGVIGGMAAQEAVKLITNQFVPINNTLIYNGLNGEAQVYEF